MPPSEAELDAIRSQMRAGIRAAGAYDKVCNDECAFSFDTPFSPEGLYVSFKSYLGFGAQFVQLDRERNGTRLYLHRKWSKIPKPPADEDDDAPSKLAIGVEGGFKSDEQQYDVVKEESLVCFGASEVEPTVRLGLPCPELPELIIQAANAHSWGRRSGASVCRCV